jgi:predicted HTH transcriptional regulator
MLKITTNWKRKVNGKPDEQVTPQHFIDVAHYRDYEAAMQKRGFQGELVEVLDLDTNKTAKIEGSKIIFGGSDA